MMEQWKQDQLDIKKYTTRQEMGAGAAADAEKVIAQIIQEKGHINMIFAAAPSQNEMLQNEVVQLRQQNMMRGSMARMRMNLPN